VTVIRHQNADAMVLAGALLGGIHPLLIFKMTDVQGGGVDSSARTGWDVAAVTLIDLLCIFAHCHEGVTALFTVLAE
jgi:hypothetical protein